MGTLDEKTFKKLRRLYIIALSLIAISVIVSQILVSKFLDSQASDSSVINIAGRQRMLSQKLTKEAYQLYTFKELTRKEKLLDTISATRKLWKLNHLALQNGNDSLNIPKVNSPKVSALFTQINPYFNAIYKVSGELVRSIEVSDSVAASKGELALSTIEDNEGKFLNLMDRIVNQYDSEAEAKIDRLRSFEFLLAILTILILLGEFIFIFLPTAKAVRKGMYDLIIAEERSKKMARDADALSDSKEKLLWESKALNQAMDKSLLFVRLDIDGNILHTGEKFNKLFKHSFIGSNTKLKDLISRKEAERNTLERIIQEHRKTGWQGELKGTTPDGKDLWLEMTLLPFTHEEERSELLIIFLDITKRKEAHDEIERLTKEGFEELIKQQKTVSRQIIENQEKEQNRIAQDLHDGIGQMLTGLKFTLESIDLSDLDKASVKITNLKKLALDIIKGVRTATFNLTPPELSDHGLVPALSKLVKELSNLTGKTIQLHNKTDFNTRLDTLLEINTYRITQEAINNAIKYAESNYIIISVAHSKNLLSVTIDDDGNGFNLENQQEIRRGDGGMGMTFMRERTNYINGRLFVNSDVGKGTRITLNIPITS
jgi:PAS domain S-box-containing protein